jgi:hypothetical protein
MTGKTKKLRPDVPFWEALRSSHKIGTLPNSNISIWNTVLSHDRENEFYPLLIKSKWYVGGTYNEAQASHPDIMVYALECEVERGTQNGTETRRIKMADIKDGDIVLKRNLHPIEFAGFKQ